MRPSPHEGTLSAWLLLAFLSSTTLAVERHYYIAAVNIDWDYSQHKTDRVFKKAVYREYEDASFTKPKLHPPSLGLLGPTLRGEEGDVIIVKFRNMVNHPCNIHTHGVSYGKQSEGALYFDNTSQKEKEDDVINPEGSHVYTWELTSGVAPTAADPPCLTHTYFSHVDMTSDYNSGLIGTLLVCKPGSLDASGNQKHFDQEQVLLFGIFDESLSWYSKGAPPSPELMKYTINGYTHGSIPGLNVCAYSSVTWHFLGMSSMPELFSVHFHGQVFAQNGHRVSSLSLVSGTTTSGVMTSLHEGRWLIASYLSQHMEAGMHGFLTVETCEAFKKPVRTLSKKERLNSRLWTYYIAAEEVIWDYTPNLPDYVDVDFKSKYLKQGPDRIGHRYKKAVFTLYTDETFTKRNEHAQRKMEQGIIGPVIRAQIRDQIKIVFKNKASRPYSIYPHGLTLDKAGEGASYPAGGNQSHGVQPGQTYTYEWNVVEEDEPLAGDARCLTRMYHSAVDTPRDIASGLIGPLLICKGQSLNQRNVQMKADKEQHAMFAIFDENKSWYLDENIQDRCTDPARVRKDAPDFYASNIMHTINGYMFESGQVLGFCNDEIATWHVSSIGEQSRIQTVTFYGHTFEVNNREEDFLSLFPMTGETVSMHMDNKGDWLLSTLNSHDSTKGMRVKFKDVECFRDYVYEYAENENDNMWNIWKAPEHVPPPPEEEPEVEKPIVIDALDDFYADILNIRSHKNTENKTTSDMELLDLRAFDYDFDSPGEDRIAQNPGKSSEPLNASDSEMLEMSTMEPLLKSPDSDVNNTMGNGINSTQTSVVNGTLDNRDYHHDNMSNEKSDNKSTNNTELVDYGKSLTAQDPEKSGQVFNVSHSDDMELLDREFGYADSIPVGNQTIQNPGKSSEVLNVSDSDVNNTDYRTNYIDIRSHNKCCNKTGIDLELLDSEFGYADSIPIGNQPTQNPGKSLEVFNVSDSDVNNTMSSAVHSTATSMLNDTGFTATVPPLVTPPIKVSSSIRGDLATLHRLLHKGRHEEELKGKGDDKQGSSPLNITVESQNKNGTRLVENTTNETSSEVGNSTTPSPSDQVITSLPVNVSSADTDPQVSLSNSSSSESSELGSFNASSVSSSERRSNESSQESGEWNSSEEVVIYLTHNKTEGMKTQTLGHPKEHWGYEVHHDNVAVKMPEDMHKYVPKETKPKKPKVRRVRPFKGHAMKTRKKKEYKPQPRSALNARGFQPRGAKPVSMNDDDLLNNEIIIGVPTFNDYDLFAHVNAIDDNLSQEEYEYIEYKDPYAQSIHEQGMTLDETTEYMLNNLPAGTNVRKYYLSIEEVDWDYGGYGQKRSDMRSDGRPTAFKKVVYKGYLDPLFRVPDIRGEVDEHLGILGPVIRAEVGDNIMVLVRNLASRPYSLHANGVSYSKYMEGLNYVDGTPYWYQKDNAIGVNQTYTYMWKVNDKVGPKEVDKNVDLKDREPDCRTWAYYSGVNPERDINSGLIGPLLVCRKGTLSKKPVDIREFVLLFMTFDENKSWYYEKNYELFERKNRRTVQDPLFKENIKFPAINGIVYALKGLRMYTNQLTNWHLINMGAANDVQSIHFHGQTFLNHQRQRQSVYPLLPGGLTTLQMTPSKPGLWLLESEVGEAQQGGMQTLFLVIDNDCGHPLGLISGSVEDKQITADHTRGYWEPHLARLHNSGKYNAWSTDERNSWIQVDFQRPVVISKVATQGAKEMFYSNYVTNYTISYSNDRRKWVFYKGDSDTTRKTFAGNSEANKVKENIFFPPLVGRFIRLHPLHSYNQPTVRMEYYGCELDGCSVPLGMKSGDIGDQKITASSTASNWYAGTWEPWLARLDKQGTVNAWQAKNNDLNQWLQVELRTVKKITGIFTQGAKSLGTRMYVTAYTLQYSKDGLRWTKYTDDPDYEMKEFEGNTDNNEHKRNYIYPPIFAKFIRIVPKRWEKAITMRLELLGCDFE
ncbi:coagulation factor V [Engraulis encrasicolus]|uniref:coagulation factor V n=1 Tax=Engraulis encrasicolus TaxID=184585 RepID=UPI002FD2A18C